LAEARCSQLGYRLELHSDRYFHQRRPGKPHGGLAQGGHYPRR